MTFKIGTILSIDKDYSKKHKEYQNKIINVDSGHIMIDYPADKSAGTYA